MTNKPIDIVLLGESATGKTSIVSRLTKNKFLDNTDTTIGAAFAIYTSNQHKFNVWDTAGQERYLSIVPMYYRRGNIIILTFDTSRLNTIERLIHYLEKIKVEIDHKYEIIIVGTKTDLSNENIKKIDSIVKEKLLKFNLDENDFIYLSSKTTVGMDSLIDKLNDKATKLYDSRTLDVTNDSKIINIKNNNDNSFYKFGFCCV